MSSESRTSFDLEPNPFERSFATKDAEEADKQNRMSTNKHNLHIPIANLNNIQQKLPGITPPLLTPGGRRLPPLGLSPGSHISIPATPGGTLWNSLLNATNTDSQANSQNPNQQQTSNDMVSVSMHPHPHQQNYGQPAQSRSQLLPQPSASHGTNQTNAVGNQQGPPSHQQQPQQSHAAQDQQSQQGLPQIHLQPSTQQGQQAPSQQVGNYSQYGNNNRKSGLTPNESNLRTGLTPSGAQHNNGNVFPFNSQLPGFTPNGIINSPMTPGLSSLLGLSHGQTHNPSVNMQNGHSLQGQNQGHLQAANNQTSTGQVANVHRQDEESPSSSPEPTGHEETQIVSKGKRKMKDTSNEETKKQKSGKGRKSKSKDQESEMAIKNEPNETSPLTSDEKDKDSRGGKKSEAEKRKHFLERNRLAASKCRQRKKEMAAKMEDELKFFSAGYRDLTSQVLQLRDQLINYRNVLSDHKTCPMMVSQIGGYNELNEMLQQTNYLIQATEKSPDAINPLPSTIATALSSGNADMDNSMGNDVTDNNSNPSNPNTNPSNNEGYDNYGGPTSHVAHNLPITDHHAVANSGATSTSSIPNGYVTVPGSGNISTHHSMTDLPAVAAAALAGNTSSVPPQNANNNQNGVNIHQPQASDVRAINSMTNLEALNHESNLGMGNQGHPHNNNTNNHGNFNLRAVSSMIDLHHINQQNNLVNMGHNT